MSGRIALYRKYRSASFADVIGQDHIVRTLTNAIASDSIAHAYLFTGPRGTGKTSVARLLAQAACCQGNPQPCGTCQACQLIGATNPDIIEIDAASNRSIDAIRELRDKVAQVPNLSRRKVYIIDEVHMLTNEAFNALLKTLEEPPTHVTFILATTEAHKVPDTIVSRTQRLVFKPFTTLILKQLIVDIAAKEGWQLEPDAAERLSLSANGGARDALSLLDQVGTAAASHKITDQLVQELLGHISQNQLMTLATSIANRDTAAALKTNADLMTSGVSASQIVSSLVGLWRRLVWLSATAQPAGALTQLVKARDLAGHTTILESLIAINQSAWPEAALETALARITLATTATATPKTQPPRTTQPVPAAANKSEPASATQPAAILDAELWPKVIMIIKRKNNSLSALLQMYTISTSADTITIKPRFNFHRDLFLKPANRNLIEAAAAKVYGQTVKIDAVTDGPTTSNRRSVKTPDPDSELMASALEILGGEVVE